MMYHFVSFFRSLAFFYVSFARFISFCFNSLSLPHTRSYTFFYLLITYTTQSDQFCDGRRKPFVYISCTLLGGVTSSMIFAKTMDQMTILCFLLGAANGKCRRFCIQFLHNPHGNGRKLSSFVLSRHKYIASYLLFTIQCTFCLIGSYLTMETSLAIDTLPKDYDDGPSGGNAQLLGIWGVAAFLGTALGPMIGGPLLYIFGNSGVTDGQDYTIEGYTILLSLSTAYFVLSAITLLWIKKANV
jgi:hypothetical protein